jgi:hypothetical protein
MDLVDIYRIFHPTAPQYTLFSAAVGKFCKIDRISGHKVSINEYKIIEIVLYILSDPNALKLELKK